MPPMDARRLLTTLLACVVVGSTSLAQNSIRNRIFVDLTPRFPCVRLLNATHQVGCHSPKFGNVGVVFWARSVDDLKLIAGASVDVAPYILLIDVLLFDSLSLDYLQTVQRHAIGVILFYDEDHAPTGTSNDDEPCPETRFELYANDTDYGHCKRVLWNPEGKGRRFVDWNMPMFLVVNKTEISYLTKYCFEKYNSKLATYDGSEPLCAAELVTYNFAAGDAIRCNRRNKMWRFLDQPVTYCTPMIGLNSYRLSPSPPNNDALQLPNRSIMVLAAKTDEMSLFSQYSPGATTMGSLIVWLAILEAVGASKNAMQELSSQYNRYLMPILFHGETFDYIGSSRFVFDLLRGRHAVNSKAPLLFNLTHIGLFVELSHLTNTVDGQVYLHFDPRSYSKHSSVKSQINRINSTLSKELPGFQPSTSDNPLPPASLQSFLKEDDAIAGVVIADYSAAYNAKHYNSFLDLPMLVNVGRFKSVAVDVANAVLALIFQWLNNDVPFKLDRRVNDSFVEQMIDCLMKWPDWNCTVMDRIAAGLQGDDQLSMMYNMHNNSRDRTGVTADNFEISSLPFTVNRVADFFLANVVNCSADVKPENCNGEGKQNDSCYYTINLFSNEDDQPCCVCSPVVYSMALSPNFLDEASPTVDSSYSTWMQSRVDSVKLRIFLKNSQRWQLRILVGGLCSFIVSIVFVFLVTQRSADLFSTPVSL